jgi:hypothetical protein
MNTLTRHYVVYCDAREGYLMDNGFFSHEVDMAKLFNNTANAKRSACYYGANVVEIERKPLGCCTPEPPKFP